MNTITVYHYRPDLTDTLTCDLGCKHRVTHHEAKRITRAPGEDYDKLIKALRYTHDGVGTVRVAYDAQGRRYESTPHWDGPGGWLRLADRKTFFTTPVIKLDAAFTLDGKRID